MSRADSGGFDLVFELSISGLRQRLQSVLEPGIPNQNVPVQNWGTLVLETDVSLTELTLLPDASIRTTLTASVTLSWPKLEGFDLFGNRITLIAAGSQVFAASTTVTMQPDAVGNDLIVRFPPDAAQVEIAPGTLEGIVGIAAFLSLVTALFGIPLETARAALYDATEQALEGPLNASLPDSVVVASLPRPPVSSVEIVAAGQELRVLMMIGGQRANADPADITRSSIRAGGPFRPPGIAAVVVGNSCVLRDLLRPMLRSGLGLSNAGFVASHPCAWLGTANLPAAATVAGVRPRVRALLTGIDSAGALRVQLAFDGEHSTGAFGIEGALDLRITVATVELADGTRELRLSVGPGVVSGLDIWVAWWVYAGGIFVSPLLVLAIALTDAFAGGGLANTINNAVRNAIGDGTLRLPLPADPSLSFGVDTTQADAEPVVLDLGPLNVSVFPANDVVVTIG